MVAKRRMGVIYSGPKLGEAALGGVGFFQSAVVGWIIFVSSGALAGAEILFTNISSLFLIPSYLFILYRIAFNFRKIAYYSITSPVLPIFITLCYASSLWSVDSTTTLLESTRLLIHYLTALCIVQWIGMKKALEVTARVLAAGCMFSLLTYFMPQISRGDYGDFRGVFQQKNTLGFAAAVEILYFMYVLSTSKKKILPLFFIAIGLANIALTNSASSVVIVLVGSAFIFTYRIVLLYRGISLRKLAVIFMAFSFLGYIGSTAADTLIGFLGRDATLTGRTDLWEEAQYLISFRPTLGYGYQVLANEKGELARYMVAKVGDYALQFHNSILNIRFQLGFPGILANIVTFFWVFLASLREANKGDPFKVSAIIAALGLALILQSFTESTFGAPRSLQTFLITIILINPRKQFVSFRGSRRSPQ